MNKNIKRILLYIFSCIFIMASATSLFSVYGKYVAEKGGSGAMGGDTGNDLPYEIASPVVVNTQEQLFEALQYGYSYVKLGDALKNPFIVTEDVTTMSRSLILDLNGKEIQRNSRDAMLRVPENVTLTIIDSASSKKGGLYNPVGSVLEVAGGTITVTAGKFESGPRPSEYYSGDGENKIDDTQDYTFDVSYKDGNSTTTKNIKMPVFKPIVSNGSDQANKYVDGNVYFDVGWKGTDFTIDPDTYCYFVTSDGFSAGDTVEFEKTNADFSYSYYTDPNNYTIISVNEPSSGVINEDYVKVTVYGYKDDIATAKGDGISSPDYAAVKMESGELNVTVKNNNVDAGSFWSYFGVEQASCVYFEGGVMNVDTTGIFSTVDPAVIRSINGSGLAADGKGICILTSSDNTGELNINGGSYVSYLGDTIRMQGGKIEVYGGSFEKDASESSDATDAANGASIHVDDGSITVNGGANSKIPFEMKGSGVIGISCDGGVLSADNVQFSVLRTNSSVGYGKNNAGIYNVGGSITVKNCDFDINSDSSVGIISMKGEGIGQGNISVAGSVFSMDGEKSKGIYQQYGTVYVDSGVFSMTGKSAVGILASEGELNIGKNSTDAYTISNSVIFYIDHIENCYGVKAAVNTDDDNSSGSTDENSRVVVNLHSVQVFIGQGTSGNTPYYTTENGSANAVNCAGIWSELENAEINVGRGVFLVAGSYSAGISIQKGMISSINTQNNHKLAVFMGVRYSNYVNGGKSGNGNWILSPVDESYYVQGTNFVDITTTPANECYGISSLGGSINIENIYVNLKSVNASGIYSNGGEVTITDFQGDFDDENTSFLTTSVLSVQGGKVSIGSGTIKTDGIGITIEGGNLNVSGEFSMTSTRSTAIFVGGGNIEFGAGSDVSIYSKIEAENSGTNISLPWRFVVDGTETKVNHYDGIKVRGGQFTSAGNLTIQHEGLYNDARGSSQKFSDFAVKSFALNVSAYDGEDTTVSIRQAAISNSCGGGVSVENGKLILGSVADKNIEVETKGTETYGEDINDDGWTNKNWYYQWSKTGGFAVSLKGGELEIYGGTYTADCGSGIIVKNGNATIHDGTFSGSLGAEAGPAGAYALSMIGGTLTVNGGTFGSKAGKSLGIMLRGDSADNMATLIFNKGVVQAGGQCAAVCLFEYSNATMGADATNDAEIDVSGGSSAITFETSGLKSYSGSNTQLTINGGSYECRRNQASVWTNVIYDAIQEATVRINGGKFTTSDSDGNLGNGYGIYFNISGAPSDFNISGGTFDTNNGAFKCNSDNVVMNNIIDAGKSVYNINGNVIGKTTTLNNAGVYVEIK